MAETKYFRVSSYYPYTHSFSLSNNTLNSALLFVAARGKINDLQHETMHAVHNLVDRRTPRDKDGIISEAIADAGIPWQISDRLMENREIQKSVTDMYREFGPDGLLLLMIRSNGLNGTQAINVLRERAIRDGTLKSGMGLTQKGVEDVLKEVKREDILHKLAEAKKARQRISARFEFK